MLKIGIILPYLNEVKRMLYFIVNKLSGKGKGSETAEKIVARLNEKNIEFKMVETKKTKARHRIGAGNFLKGGLHRACCSWR